MRLMIPEEKSVQGDAPKKRGCGFWILAITVTAIIGVNFLPPGFLLGCGPSHFHGRVIDQNGLPVAGAKVVHSANLSISGNNKRYVTKSDSDGYFFVYHPFSWVFVTISKEGYEYSPSTAGKRGSQDSISPEVAYPASASNPIIFRLERK